MTTVLLRQRDRPLRETISSHISPFILLDYIVVTIFAFPFGVLQIVTLLVVRLDDRLFAQYSTLTAYPPPFRSIRTIDFRPIRYADGKVRNESSYLYISLFKHNSFGKQIVPYNYVTRVSGPIVFSISIYRTCFSIKFGM